MPPRPGTLAALLVAVAVALSGCQEDDPTVPSGALAEELAGRLLSSAPAGYSPGPDDAAGPAGLADVSQATPADASVLGSALEEAGFRGGYTRVWLQGDASLSAVVMRVGSVDGAREVVRVAADDLARSQSTIVEPLQGVADATRYLVNGRRRTGDDVLFCQGAFLSRGADVFALTNCAPYPLFTGDVERAVRTQVAQAERTDG